jgi:hypothetical protein
MHSASSTRLSWNVPPFLALLFDVICLSRDQWFSAPPLCFYPQQLVNLFNRRTSCQCAQEFWHPCSSGAFGYVRDRLTEIKSAHHWKSMMCLTCFFAISKFTLPSGHLLQTSRYSKDIWTGSGVTSANKLHFGLILRPPELRLRSHQGLPNNVSPTIIPSARVNSWFRTTSSYALTFPLLITGT